MTSPPSGVVVLAGGENARLKPLSSTIYKPFLPIHGLSLLARQVFRVAMSGFEHVLILSDEPDALLIEYATGGKQHGAMSGTELDVQIVAHGGTTGAKILHATQVHPEWQPLLVCLGDTFAKLDWRTLALTPARIDVDSALCAARYRMPFGVLSVDGTHVTSFREKPITEWLINTGYMALGPKALESLRETADLALTLSDLGAKGELALSEIVDECLMVDTLVDLAAAHERLEAGRPLTTLD